MAREWQQCQSSCAKDGQYSRLVSFSSRNRLSFSLIMNVTVETGCCLFVSTLLRLCYSSLCDFMWRRVVSCPWSGLPCSPTGHHRGRLVPAAHGTDRQLLLTFRQVRGGRRAMASSPLVATAAPSCARTATSTSCSFIGASERGRHRRPDLVPDLDDELHLGHSVSTLKEALALAARSGYGTALLSARHIAGDETWSDQLASGAMKSWEKEPTMLTPWPPTSRTATPGR